MAAAVEHRLEDDSPDRRVLQPKLYDRAQLVVVHPPLDGRHQGHIHVGLCQPVQGLELFVQQVLASDGLIRIRLQAIELHIDIGASLGQLLHESVIPGDADPIGVYHHMLYALIPGHLHHIEDTRMYGWLAPAELYHLRLAFQFHEAVQHRLHLGQAQVISGAGIGEADGAVQVAGRIHLDDGQAGMLLMLRTEPTVQGAPLLHLGAELLGDSARLIEFQGIDIHLGVGAEDAFEPPVLLATLAHIHLSVPENYLCIDDCFALRAYASGELEEDVVMLPVNLGLRFFL